MIEISSFLGGKNLCNIFADLIVKKINEVFPDAKTQISVINVRNFFIVKGVTTSDVVINIAEILTKLYEKYDLDLSNKVRVIDSVVYNKSFDHNLHISLFENKKDKKEISKLSKICNDLQKEGYYITIKLINGTIFYDFDHDKDFDPSYIKSKFEDYVTIKDDFSQDIYCSDEVYGLSNHGLKYYHFLLKKISFNLLNRGFMDSLNITTSSTLNLKDIDSNNIILNIGGNSVIKNEQLESLILDVFDFSLSNLEKEFNVSDFDVLKSYEECDYIKIWETYEGTRDLMFL